METVQWILKLDECAKGMLGIEPSVYFLDEDYFLGALTNTLEDDSSLVYEVKDYLKEALYVQYDTAAAAAFYVLAMAGYDLRLERTRIFDMPDMIWTKNIMDEF